MAKLRIKHYNDGTARVINGRRRSSPFTWTPDYLTGQWQSSELYKYQIDQVFWAAVEVGASMSEQAVEILHRAEERARRDR